MAWYLIAGAAIGAACVPAGAQVNQGSPTSADTTRSNAADTTHKKTLGPIIVTATRAQTPLSEMALHTTVITHEEIQESPFQTLDLLLRAVSGMNETGGPYYTTDPTGQTTRMRGVTNSTVLVLVDGIPVLDPFYNTTQFFKVPLSSIDRIEVLRGGASALWGNLAVAGVVNIITRTPVDNSTEVDADYQSAVNTEDVALSKNLLVGDGLALRFSGNLLTSGGYQTTPSQYLVDYPGKSTSGATSGNGQVSGYYDPGDGWTAFLKAGYGLSDQDIGGYTHGWNDMQNPDASGGFTKALSDKVRADVRVWTQFVNFEKENGAGCYLASPTNCNTTSTTSPLVQYNTSYDINPYHEIGGSAVMSVNDVARALSGVQIGLDYRTVGGSDTSTTYNKPTTTDIAYSTIDRENYGQGTQQFLGVFTQLAVTPVTHLEATLNLRYDYWIDQAGIAELTRYSDGVPGALTGGPLPNSYKGAFDPSLSARYDFGSVFDLRAAAYQSFRAPGLNNLYRSYSSSTQISIANPDLSPETLVGGEVGADMHLSPVTLGATLYYYYTKDLIATYKITKAATAPPDVIAICGATLSNCPANIVFNTNAQNAVARGIETTGLWQVTHSLAVDGTFTYTDSHYTSTTVAEPINAQLGGIPKDFATLGVTWQLTRRWNAYAGAQYDGSMYLDVYHTIPQKTFTLLNFNTSYQLTQGLQVYVAGVNLTNVVYSDVATTAADGESLGVPRIFTVGFRWRY